MRSLLDGIRLAILAIVRNPMRASLTVLGILIGVAAVVTVTALGSGIRESMSARIQAIGSNFIIIYPEAVQASGARGAQGSGMRLTEEDGRAIMRDTPSLIAMAPAVRSAVQIVYGDQNRTTQAIGTTLPYLTVRSWPVERGATWDAHDEATKAKVVLIGTTVATSLFGNEDPVGRLVRIGRYPFRVLGVLASKGEAPFGLDQDDIILMPSTSFRARVMHTPPGFAGALMAATASSDVTDHAVHSIESILRQRHRIEPGRPADFAILTQKEMADLWAMIDGQVTYLLIFVAAISLVVGGIGIMNIMLVSVTERTREIGIRMAIGARENDIRTQFLVEAVALSLLGGFAGMAFGGAAIWAIHAIVGLKNMTLSPVAIGVSLVVSLATGIAFGFIPARRAAALDPIEALRHE
jgi:putative ABC transport system permease protein